MPALCLKRTFSGHDGWTGSSHKTALDVPLSLGVKYGRYHPGMSILSGYAEEAGGRLAC
jgi:hypothetical protein